MKQNALKMLGFGFLASALLTGGFEIFARGNMPVKGVTVQSIFSEDKEKIEMQESISESLKNENEKINSENSDLKESISSLESIQKENESKIKTLDKEVASLKLEYVGSEENESTNSDETNSISENNNTEKGTFSITDGESSSDIASRLQSEGYINSAEEFQQLIDSWELNQFIQANSYELSSDMSMNEILSIITNGAYYY